MSISFMLMEDVTISVTVSNAAGCCTTDQMMVTGMFAMSTSSTEGENGFNLYPNPATNEVNLTFGVTGVLNNSVMTITELQGKPISSKMLAHIENGQNVQIDVSGLAKGLYLITIGNEKTRMTARFSKQ